MNRPKDSPSLRESLGTELEETRTAFRLLVDSLSDADWKRKSANPAWTVGELLYHIAVSQRFIAPEVKRAQRQRRLPPFPVFIFDWLQAIFIRWGARRHSLSAVARLYDAEHKRVLVALDTVGDDEWQKGVTYPNIDPPLLAGFMTVETMFRYQKHHFEAHAGQIRRPLTSET
jgi:hypothetical protein